MTFKTILRLTVLFSLLTTLGFASTKAMDWIRTHPYFKVENIRLVLPENMLQNASYQQLPKKEMLRKLEAIKGQNIWQLSEKKWTSVIKDYPWVFEASLTKRLPNTIELSLRTHTVQNLWNDGHKLFFVSPDGQLIKEVEPGEFADYPLLSGLKKKDLPWMVNVSKDLLRQFREKVGLQAEDIGELSFENRESVTVFLEHKYGRVQVKLTPWKMGEKAELFRRILNESYEKDVFLRKVDLISGKKGVVKISAAP
jgi:cell division septal protein FtsQ